MSELDDLARRLDATDAGLAALKARQTPPPAPAAAGGVDVSPMWMRRLLSAGPIRTSAPERRHRDALADLDRPSRAVVDLHLPAGAADELAALAANREKMDAVPAAQQALERAQELLAQVADDGTASANEIESARANVRIVAGEAAAAEAAAKGITREALDASAQNLHQRIDQAREAEAERALKDLAREIPRAIAIEHVRGIAERAREGGGDPSGDLATEIRRRGQEDAQ